MADNNKQVRKARKRKETQDAKPEQKDEPTKEEYAIAKWMRKNVVTKKTKFLNHTVDYFNANKAIDQLMDSPWAKSKKEGDEALFTTRESIVDYLEGMLRHKLFHRARKIVVPESELKSKKKKDKEDDKEKEKENTQESKEKEEKASKKEETATAAESSHAEGDKTESKAEKRKKKDEGEKKRRKIRLDMHLDQRFVDGTDAYVWIYEPTSYLNYFFGFLVVVAVIAVCLFPLWPSSVRQGVYYLSLAAAGFLVFILALAVIRMVVFGIVWGLTFGRHHLWLLPNLTEDVGFTASFWPLYKYEYKPGDEDEKKKSDSKTDDDESNEGKELLGNNEESGESSKPAAPADQSETESEGSQPSQTGKDFEMVDREEIDT